MEGYRGGKCREDYNMKVAMALGSGILRYSLKWFMI